MMSDDLNAAVERLTKHASWATKERHLDAYEHTGEGEELFATDLRRVLASFGERAPPEVSGAHDGGEPDHSSLPPAEPLPSSPALTREELAAIIDPDAFAFGFQPERGAVQNDVDAACKRALTKADAILARLSPLQSLEKQQNQEHTVSVAESGGSPTTSVKSDSPHSDGGRG